MLYRKILIFILAIFTNSSVFAGHLPVHKISLVRGSDDGVYYFEIKDSENHALDIPDGFVNSLKAMERTFEITPIQDINNFSSFSTTLTDKGKESELKINLQKTISSDKAFRSCFQYWHNTKLNIEDKLMFYSSLSEKGHKDTIAIYSKSLNDVIKNDFYNCTTKYDSIFIDAEPFIADRLNQGFINWWNNIFYETSQGFYFFFNSVKVTFNQKYKEFSEVDNDLSKRWLQSVADNNFKEEDIKQLEEILIKRNDYTPFSLSFEMLRQFSTIEEVKDLFKNNKSTPDLKKYSSLYDRLVSSCFYKGQYRCFSKEKVKNHLWVLRYESERLKIPFYSLIGSN